MATYVIGDVQGCFTTLVRLLARIDFDQSRDRLWLVGDLVNRGPHSLAVLRWARDLGERAVTVLGNHDLHLVDYARGARERKRRDTLDHVLKAPDKDELVEWLSSRPLFYREDGYVLVHAGLLPFWDLDTAEALAREAEEALRRDAVDDRLQVVIDAFTRLRTCTGSGEMCLDYAGPPEGAPAGCRPWYELVKIPEGITVLFGHWASLGLHVGANVIGLDTGCVWGGALTALRLEDRELFQEPSELA